MWMWVAIGLVVVVGPALWRRWVVQRALAEVMALPIFPSSYAQEDPAAIPVSIRDGLAVASAELVPLGFEHVGYIAGPVFPGMPPRVLAIHRHPREGTFANAAFALGAFKGVIVEFVTLFADGGWLWTVNRRGHVFRDDYAKGRVKDCVATTIAEQWQVHREHLATEPGRARHDPDLAGLADHLNGVTEEENDLAIADGSRRRSDDGESFRFTRQGATLHIEAAQKAAQRRAGAPPLTGALAMPLPVDELERKYQDFVFIRSQWPRMRGVRAFLISMIAFAATAVFFPTWIWILWLIPFLLLHELGHFATLRLFGHSDATIRFVPFMGAATLTTTQFRKLSHEMIVLLAGPVPGIVLALALFQLTDFAHASYTVGIAITLVTLNGLNLLPAYPLDGGRIVHALVSAGRPAVDMGLRAFAASLFVGLAIAYRDITLAILGVGSFLLLGSGVRRARLEEAIRRRPDFDPALAPQQHRRFIFEALSGKEGSNGRAWLSSVQELAVSLRHGQAPWTQTLPWFALYAAVLGGRRVDGERARGDSRCPI
jgi:Zn-dependent protease